MTTTSKRANSDEPTHKRGVHAAALAALPRAGPRRLHRLLADTTPEEAWERVLNGLIPTSVAEKDLRRSWAAHAARFDLERMSRTLDELDVYVTTPGDPGHPTRLATDIYPAPIIFRQGRPVDADAPAVTVVGTRRCSPTGRSVAFELGTGLAEAGVTVVSGLALGIDGAVHRGVLSVDGAPPVGVVGSGLSVVYPKGNSDLWQSVGESGTLLSESPINGRPEAWRFPARNRLLAALADVVVVVESKRSGGSMLTVEESIRRGVTVMAVPGSVRNPASVGTNTLISEGCAPVCDVADVLTAVDLATADRQIAPVSAATDTGKSAKTRQRNTTKQSNATSNTVRPRNATKQPDTARQPNITEQPAAARQPNAHSPMDERSSYGKQPLSDRQQLLISVIDDNPVGLNQIVLRSGIPVPIVLAEIAELEAKGVLSSNEGQIMQTT